MTTMQKYNNFTKSLSNLHKTFSLEEPYNIVEQTGIVRLFEICFDQSWKMMKVFLEEEEKVECRMGTPRAIIETACRSEMIKDEDRNIWMEMLEARNVIAHDYTDEEAMAAIRAVKSSYIRAFDELRNCIEMDWIVLW